VKFNHTYLKVKDRQSKILVQLKNGACSLIDGARMLKALTPVFGVIFQTFDFS
jgi:hypothetical protein